MENAHPVFHLFTSFVYLQRLLAVCNATVTSDTTSPAPETTRPKYMKVFIIFLGARYSSQISHCFR
jgi:hypothetical protein